MTDSLRSKTIRALSWSFLESISLQAVRFVIGIVLARLLFPEQFGLIGMLMIFMAVAQSFLDSGFGAALIQKHDATQTDICSVFYFNIVVGVVAAGILCLIAPWIAAFYNQHILTPMMRALSLILIIDSLSLIQGTLLAKEINFKPLTKVSLISGIMSGIVGVALAVSGFEVWSLVAQQISSALFRTAFLWLLNPWRPTLIFSLRSLREMFAFGSKIFASGVLNKIFENIYLLAIGKLFSATDLGFFTRAKAFADFPSHTLAGMVGRVTFPVFSTIQDDSARLKRSMKKTLTTLVMVNFPMMLGMAVIARPLVVLLLTEKWAPCIPYLQLLCFSGMLFPLHFINLNLLLALGRSDLFLRLEIIKKVLIAMNIFITWRWGISAMIGGMIALSIFSYYLNSYYSGMLIKYPIWEQLRDVFKYIMISGTMGLAVYGTGLLPFPNLWSLLLGQIAIGVLIYVCLCRLFRLTVFMELWRAGWNRMPFFTSGNAG